MADEQQNQSKIPTVTFDPELEKFQGQVLFPEKLEKANEMLKTAKLPPNKNKTS
jgi:hypothetical protein